MAISVSSMGWEAVSSWARWEILTVRGGSVAVVGWVGSQVATVESSCLMTVGEICEGAGLVGRRKLRVGEEE